MKSSKTSIILALVLFLAPAHAADLVGHPRVVDGDTIEIDGQLIRMHGIDAPEASQLCRKKSGETWLCGQKSARVLADRIGSSVVECNQRDVDRYGRIVAVCFDGGDLNEFMVRSGMAVAYKRYSSDYIKAENSAIVENLGIWAGEFIMPARWRRGDRMSAPIGASDDCTIKGNISNSGEKIYHLPGGQYYDLTRISNEEGERYFCSEDEARKAGWRKSKR